MEEIVGTIEKKEFKDIKLRDAQEINENINKVDNKRDG